jgi:GT2 family glycosyltransferase/glycosyltransferase involved in cell wall biosynthesis
LPSVLTPADVILRETVAPFPSSIFPQTARRFSGLRALLETMDRESDFAQITHAMRTVEGGYDNVDLENLHFPVEDSPEVSIIIPAHNNVKVTYLALCSLLIAPSKARFEVIVVDDASSDETAHLEEIVSGITVIHNETSQRFIRACNAGAKVARGEYIVLLNNDVEVTMGWLDELMAAFDRFENVGLAGAKLVYPNGRLQDGGGIIWNSGNPSNYGKGENPEDPRFCYARQADYLCGAAMMVPKTVWDELGGLSAYLEPMYFEDTDFAFKVREAGFKTWFVPSSVVYHYEGMTSGNDVTKGAKRFQEINRPKFKERWADAFSSFGPEGEEPDLEKDRGIQGRVLFVDYTTPRPDRDAGSYAALQEIRLVQALGYKVSFLPTNLGHLGKYTEDLQKIGVEMIYAPFFLSVQEYLAEHAADFDAIYVTRYYVAKEVLPTVRSYAPNAKVLFNNADLHFLRELRSARVEDDEEKLAAALRTRDQEMEIIGKVDVVLSYSSSEHAVIEAFSDGAARIVRTPWVVEVPAKTAPLAGRHGLSFLGSFNHHPNEEGIVWFTNQVMPMVAAKIPDVGLSIYGSNMKDSLRDLASEHVNPVGYVDDLAQAFDPHRIFIAPLLSGAGIKGKVIEALARGVPCVLSPLAAEGIGLRNGLDCFIARTPDEWLEAIQKLNSDDRVWHEMSNRARDYMAEAFSFERGKAAMHEAFEAAGILPQEISVAQARKVEFRH